MILGGVLATAGNPTNILAMVESGSEEVHTGVENRMVKTEKKKSSILFDPLASPLGYLMC